MENRASDVLHQTQNARRPPKSPPAVTEWSSLLLRDVVCSERVTVRHAAERTIRSLPGVMEVRSAFLSLTSDL